MLRTCKISAQFADTLLFSVDANFNSSLLKLPAFQNCFSRYALETHTEVLAAGFPQPIWQWINRRAANTPPCS